MSMYLFMRLERSWKLMIRLNLRNNSKISVTISNQPYFEKNRHREDLIKTRQYFDNVKLKAIH